MEAIFSFIIILDSIQFNPQIKLVNSLKTLQSRVYIK